MTIEELREEINRIDGEILSLLNSRASCARQIGELKQRNGLLTYHPAREEEIYRRLMADNSGPLLSESICAIYAEIISACRGIESPIKVAYLGPEATFTHMAARRKFGSSVEFVPAASIADVFIEVDKKRADYGVVPIENSTEGVITHTLDMFIESNLKICAEILLEISQCLLSKLSLGEIRRVYSHPHAFAQIRGWLKSNLPAVECVEVSSTAEASRRAAIEPNSAAVGSDLAAQVYQLNILSKGIEDRVDNYTRFLIIGSSSVGRSGNDKTSVMFSIKDRVGALYAMLSPFAKYNVNLTKIESRPSKNTTWEYIFFIDMNGHIEDENVKKAIDDLQKDCLYLKVLGSYPVAG
ncbi:prephenate dehydratase [bacterium]|nr:prephenate dehydratase [bacterium]MBU1752826.1 prephenate dehydratase [bacterium]